MLVTQSRRARRAALFLMSLLVVALVVHTETMRAGAQQQSSIALVREGYERILALYVDPLEPDQLLEEAWNGAAGAAIAAGMDRIPSLGTLPPDRAGAWTAFSAAYSALEQDSAGVIDNRQLAYAALDAMAEARNECHTYFMPPERYLRFRDSLDGRTEFGGIGVRSTQQPPFTITQVIPGSPAAQAGLLAGDVIIAVDGVPAAEQTGATLTELIRGEVDTTVTITIKRPGEEEPRDLTITRAIIRVPILTSELRADGVAVIALSTFATDGSSERLLREALADVEARGAKGWILDLRLNPGGSVTSFLSVLGVFLPRDTTAATVTERRFPTTRFGPTGAPAAVQRPMAVLVGPGTGSGAEITAAVLQDTGRARLFGQRTAGCANIGTLAELTDGSALVITSARLLAGPMERQIDGAGVTPDQETMAGATDVTLQAAVAHLLARLPVSAGS